MPSGQRSMVFNGLNCPCFHSSMVMEACSTSRVGAKRSSWKNSVLVLGTVKEMHLILSLLTTQALFTSTLAMSKYFLLSKVMPC